MKEHQLRATPFHKTFFFVVTSLSSKGSIMGRSSKRRRGEAASRLSHSVILALPSVAPPSKKVRLRALMDCGIWMSSGLISNV